MNKILTFTLFFSTFLSYAIQKNQLTPKTETVNIIPSAQLNEEIKDNIKVLNSATQSNDKFGLKTLVQFENGECVDSKTLGYDIVAKISDKKYQLEGDNRTTMGTAFLNTKDTFYDSTGLLVGIHIRLIGKKEVTTSNGFKTQAHVWEECHYDLKTACLPEGIGIGYATFAWPRAKKGLNCSK